MRRSSVGGLLSSSWLIYCHARAEDEGDRGGGRLAYRNPPLPRVVNGVKETTERGPPMRESALIKRGPRARGAVIRGATRIRRISNRTGGGEDTNTVN